jgi:hypothetical protein
MTQFCKEVNFDSAKFSKKADFDSVKFSGETKFSSAKFLDRAYFDSAEFCGVANFTSAEFSAEVVFSKILIKDKMFFNYVFFDDGNKILFNTNNLTKVYFSYTDITKVRFGDRPGWSKENEFRITEEELVEKSAEYCIGLKKYLKENGNEDTKSPFKYNEHLFHIKFVNGKAIVWNDNDEQRYTFIVNGNGNNIEPHLSKLEVYPGLEISLESIMAVYRNLRENHEFRFRYDESSHFFLREMEVKRRYKEVSSGANAKIELNNWFRRNLFSITGIYYNLFGYGERLKRIALTTVLLFAVFSTAYFVATFVLPEINLPPNSQKIKPTENMDRFVNSTLTTLSDMFQIKGSGLQPLEYVIRILSLPLFGIVIIALKRKFERKVRH